MKTLLDQLANYADYHRSARNIAIIPLQLKTYAIFSYSVGSMKSNSK